MKSEAGWTRMMEDPVFRAALKAQWSDLRMGVLSNTQLLWNVEEAASYLEINGAVGRNYLKWDQVDGFDYQAQI